jgi:N utilization substance protein A
MTGATVVDCIVNDEENSIIFTVKKGEVGLAVGKRGEKIKRFRNMTNKQVEIYEYMNEPEKFIKNALKPAKVKDIRLVDRMEGKRIAMVNVEPKDKGIAIGKNGINIKKIRFLANRYFQLDTVIIN